MSCNTVLQLKYFLKELSLFWYTGGQNETEKKAAVCHQQIWESKPLLHSLLFSPGPRYYQVLLMREKKDRCLSSTVHCISHSFPAAGCIWLLDVQQKLLFILSRCSSSGLKTPQNTSINMQLPSRETTPYFNNMDQKDLVGYSSSRANSVPIIPSVGLDEACMQMQNVSEVTGIKWCKNSYSAELVNVSSPVSNCLIAEQHEVKILLETVQEQIRILTDARRSEDYELASVEAESSVSENTAFLPMSPMAKSEREAQFVLKSKTQRDSVLTKWLCVGVVGGETRSVHSMLC